MSNPGPATYKTADFCVPNLGVLRTVLPPIPLYGSPSYIVDREPWSNWGWQPPFGMQYLWVRSTQIAVRSTHKFCYIVRRHHFLVFKGQFFIQKHNKIVIQSETTKFLRARAVLGHLNILNINIDCGGGSKTGKSNKQRHQSKRFQ